MKRTAPDTHRPLPLTPAQVWDAVNAALGPQPNEVGPMQILEAGDTPPSEDFKRLVDLVVLVTGPQSGDFHRDAAEAVKNKCAQKGLHPVFVYAPGNPDTEALKTCLQGRVTPYTSVLCIAKGGPNDREHTSATAHEESTARTLGDWLCTQVGVKPDGSPAQCKSPIYIQSNLPGGEMDRLDAELAHCRTLQRDATRHLCEAYVPELATWCRERQPNLDQRKLDEMIDSRISWHFPFDVSPFERLYSDTNNAPLPVVERPLPVLYQGTVFTVPYERHIEHPQTTSLRTCTIPPHVRSVAAEKCHAMSTLDWVPAHVQKLLIGNCSSLQVVSLQEATNLRDCVIQSNPEIKRISLPEGLTRLSLSYEEGITITSLPPQLLRLELKRMHQPITIGGITSPDLMGVTFPTSLMDVCSEGLDGEDLAVSGVVAGSAQNNRLPARHGPARSGAEVLFRTGADQEAQR